MIGIVCQVCAKRPATSHLTELGPDGGDRQELHICATCISNLGLELGSTPIPIAEILASKGHIVESLDDDAENDATSEVSPETQVACPVCGLTFGEFSANNRFGCAQCYDAFREHVEPLLARYHGTAVHTGRLPTQGHHPSGTARLARRTHLDQALKQALASEDFRRAAQLRDELRDLDEAAS